MEKIIFPFPFKPYDVQEDFMKELYGVLDKKQIGIFESPTGTGKSLSLICGSLKWLKDFQKNEKLELEELISLSIENDNSNNWFEEFLQKQDKTHKIQNAKEKYDFLVQHERKIQLLKNSENYKERKNVSNRSYNKVKQIDNEEEISDDEFILENTETEELQESEKPHDVIKIFYASRTHSQLSQFLREIQRSPYKHEVTVTSLGSRANFCINSYVKNLKNIGLINEHCINLQKKKINKTGCTFMKNFDDLQNNILADVLDIEDLIHVAKEVHSCPYYATRKVIPDVEMVLLPYNILLHKPMRETFGINLKENILIIDEAHNLVEAVNGMYSSQISLQVIVQTYLQVNDYFKYYCSRLSQNNLRFIKQLLKTLQLIIDYLKDFKTNNSSTLIHVYDFLNEALKGSINLFDIIKQAEGSLIGQKVYGFTTSRIVKGIMPTEILEKPRKEKVGIHSFLLEIKEKKSLKPDTLKDAKDTIGTQNIKDFQPSAIFNFLEFVKTLTFPTEDGRVLIHKATDPNETFLKFLHLNPATHFKEIVQEARSIILAGGTMQPVSEFFDQLFIPAGVARERIHVFSCGHVIPPENLLAIGLSTGPCGKTLDFTFKSRCAPETIKELGSTLINISNIVNGGVVCFFPSYDYEEFVHNELNKSKVLDILNKRFEVFREPRKSSDVDMILNRYSKCIFDSSSGRNSRHGAILFSIVGGKMSEGINFSDNLGRCVIMVGLPYPNKFSIELTEKMTYLNCNFPPVNGKQAGDVYYNNLCLKAVNQSIGRAIRHKDDFATILLLDHRYSNSSVKELLPTWICKSLSFHDKFGSAYFSLRNFFNKRK